ncbi:hypothetical protein ACQKL5_13900 [Peribacillus sp. NPDC097675]|uniref:hypothetical protein n=1 Tax=Peribacillus sp. NPDC097675 TaxID=3390618 RepID=UPI003D0203D1
MIYEETYHYLLKHVSSTEFDTCLYSLLHSDWDGVIQSPLHMMANGVGTSEKYMKQIVRNFTSPKGELPQIFVPVQQDGEMLYKFNLGPTSNLGFNRKTDRYCKKYCFFYRDAFKGLTISAKRLLLMGAYRMSVSKSEEVIFDYQEIVSEPNPLFTRQRLLESIEAIYRAGLFDLVNISFTCKTFSKKEAVVFTFKEGTLEDFRENRAERAGLRRTIFDSGFTGHISDGVCMELERVGKYVFRSFLKDAKKADTPSETQKELLTLARFVYSQALKKFGKALQANKQLLTEPKQASAYLSTIVYNETLEQMAKYAHRAESIKSLLDREHFHKEISEKALGREVNYMEVSHHVEPIRLKFQQADFIHTILNGWCEDWLISRVKMVTEEVEAEGEISTTKKSHAQKRSALDYIISLRNDTYDQLDKLHALIGKFGNAAVAPSTQLYPFTKKKETIQSYFAILRERLDVISACSS